MAVCRGPREPVPWLAERGTGEDAEGAEPETAPIQSSMNACPTPTQPRALSFWTPACTPAKRTASTPVGTVPHTLSGSSAPSPKPGSRLCRRPGWRTWGREMSSEPGPHLNRGPRILSCSPGIWGTPPHTPTTEERLHKSFSQWLSCPSGKCWELGCWGKLGSTNGPERAKVGSRGSWGSRPPPSRCTLCLYLRHRLGPGKIPACFKVCASGLKSVGLRGSAPSF